MKRTAALSLSLALALALASIIPPLAQAQGSAAKVPVFSVRIAQQGAADGASFEKSVEAVYAPCSCWNSGLFGGATPGGVFVPGAQAAGTPEALLAQRGGIAGLKPGEALQLYVRQKSGSGKDSGGTSGTVKTIGDGLFSWTVKSGSQTQTYDNSGAASSNPAMGPPAHADAEILRTEDGAVLRFKEPFLEAEGNGDFFGLFEGDNVPAGIREALSFKFTNDELKSWSSLQKTNDLTLNGPLGGALKIRVSFHGGALSDGAEVKLDGCFEVGEGGQGQVTASGKPAGGTYRFRVVPPEAMKVQAAGNTATLTGGSPDRGTLFVEYATPDGKTAEASHAVASVRVESVNGGAPVPEIPLYDFDQKKLPAVVEVPFKASPAGAADNIVFVPEDPAVVTLVNLGNAVAIQGLREGKTTFQARFKCGGPFGPVVPVEVVRCDKETIAKLDQMLRDAAEARRAAAKDFSAAMGSKEFQEAADKIGLSTFNLARKTIVLIVGAAAGYGTPDKYVKTIADVSGKLDAVVDIITDIATQPGAVDQITNWAGLIAEFSEKQMAQTIFDVQDAVSAATEFGKQLGDLTGQTRRMAEAARWIEHWNKVIEDIVARQRFCRKTEQPPQEQKPPKEPEKPQPKPKTDPAKPKPPTAPTPKPTPPGETPGGGEVSPPPPTSPPRQVGLPYDPSDCGCGKALAIGQNPDGFASLDKGFGNLLDCVDRFNAELSGYAATLQEMTAVFGRLEAATKAGGPTLSAAAKQAAPAIAGFSAKVKAFGTAGQTFADGFRTCPESMKAGISFLQSAKDYAKSAEAEGAIGVRK